MQELSLNVLDIAQNSVVAKATLIRIGVEEDTASHRMVITIADNGVGISEKQLAEIRHTLDSKIVDYEKHFGIGNVNKRISNPYFGNGHISIDSRLYHGTKITIEFNQMEEENEESNDC